MYLAYTYIYTRCIEDSVHLFTMFSTTDVPHMAMLVYFVLEYSCKHLLQYMFVLCCFIRSLYIYEFINLFLY